MMRILVTGGAGFLGSNLCKSLLEKNSKVICLDNLFTGRMENISELLKNPNFEFLNHDIVNPIFIDGEIDQIYNLACPASPPHYQYNAIKTIKCNTLGMINILGLAKEKKARILQASTSEIYGNPLEHPQSETYWGNVNPIGIRSCYDEGKRVAETLMFDYHRQNKVDIRVIRIFNTYGPKMDPADGRVVSNFIMQALKNEDITIYGNGNQTRSFCYVSDLINGFLKLMNQNEIIGPVNVGNPVERTILELAKKIINLTNSKSQIIYQKLPSDDPCKRKPNISLAKEKLNWQPLVEIDEGLNKTIEYFKQFV